MVAGQRNGLMLLLRLRRWFRFAGSFDGFPTHPGSPCCYEGVLALENPAILPASLISLFVALLPVRANAELNHTWIASNGSDAANCDRSTPCRTFTGAIPQTAA